MNKGLLTSRERAELEKLIARNPNADIRRRAQLFLLYDDGLPTREVAARVGLSRGRTRWWRLAFQRRGLELLTLSSSALAQLDAEVDDSDPAIAQPIFIPASSAPGVIPDDPVSEAGRKVLAFHFQQMLKHEKGTRQGEDIEALHDMRVATRRMRAAIEVFNRFFQPKVIKKVRSGLRDTGRALGPVRDLDVFIENAEKYRQTLPGTERQGMQPLVDRWVEERVVARQKMISFLDSQNYVEFIAAMKDFVESPGKGAIEFKPSSPIPFRVLEVAPMMIYTRLAEVRMYDLFLQSASFEQLHSLRIAFKYLRYTLEFFREVLGPEVKAVIEETKRMQDHLGELNDANVACHLLQDFIQNWEKRQLDQPLDTRQSPEQLVFYLAAQTEMRHRLLISFPEAWSRFNRPDFHHNLAASIAVL